MKVQFRKHRGEVVAVFPYVIEAGTRVMCYAHIGQHSTCDPDFNTFTTAATPDEYAPLFKELTSIGYELEIIKRRNHAEYLRAYYKSINS